MTKILVIEYDNGFYYAKTPTNKIVFGGRVNIGCVDGLSLKAVMNASIEYADVIHAPLLEVKQVEENK